MGTKKEIPASDWIAMGVQSWCKMVGISVSHAYQMAAAGQLHFSKIGTRTLITREESDRVLAHVTMDAIAAHPLAQKRRGVTKERQGAEAA